MGPPTPRAVARAESVGSLLRAPEMERKIDEIYGGLTVASPSFVLPERAGDLAELAQMADQALPEMLRRQVDAGMDVVTDGEIRRTTFLGSFFDAVGGLRAPDERYHYADADGNVFFDFYGDPVLAEGAIHKARNPLADEAIALRVAGAPIPFKLTLPAASYAVVLLEDGLASSEAYADRDALAEDILVILREMVAEAVAAGATWIQFDGGTYPSLGRRTEDPAAFDRALAAAIDLDRRVLEGIPGHVTTAMHLCRGNFIVGGKGALDPVAEPMFNELPYDRWLIEWDKPDDHGDFSALRHLPAERVVVLGLISTKTPELESEDAIVAKIEDAAQHTPLDRLAVSPQCGFSSVSHDHLIDATDVQWRKLELVGRVADRVWGRD